jgi:glycosyltransferase 2 family protein
VNKRLAINLLKYLLAVSVLSYVVWSNWAPANGRGLSYVWEHHILTGGAGVHWDYLFYAFALFAAGVVLTLVRWYLLVRCQGLPLTLWNAIRLGMIGCFFNAFLPGSVGGDIIKAAALAREQSRRTVAVATVVMDRVIGLWGLFWFVGLLGVVFWLTGQLEAEGAEGKSKRVIVITLAFLAVSVVVWLAMGFLTNDRAEKFALRLARIPKVGGSVAELWRAVWLYRCQPLYVCISIMLSWLGFALFVPSFYFSALTLYSDQLGPMPTLQQHFILVPIGLIIAAVPGFPGGAGISELGFDKLYELFKGTGSIGVMGSLVQRIIQWAIGLIGYVFYVAVPAGPVAGSLPPLKIPARQPAELPEETAAQVWLPAPVEGTTAS